MNDLNSFLMNRFMNFQVVISNIPFLISLFQQSKPWSINPPASSHMSWNKLCAVAACIVVKAILVQCDSSYVIRSDVINCDVINSDVINDDVTNRDVIDSDVISSDVINSDVIGYNGTVPSKLLFETPQSP